jgi:Cu2+-exporting ATPase/Cu+-exporting ATPase
MERIEFSIKGMSCATCALNIENVFRDENISKYAVNFASESGYIESENPKEALKSINIKLKPLGYEILTDQKDIQKIQLEEKLSKLKYILPISLTIFLYMTYEISTMFFPSLPKVHLPYIVINIVLLISSTVILFSVGRPFLRGIQRFLKKEGANMDTLIGIGTFSAYIYSIFVFLNEILNIGVNINENTFFDAVIVVIGFVYLGKYLEYRSKYKTGEAIKKLATLQAKAAILLRDGKQVEVKVEDIKIGDILVIKPGSIIPVDGKIVKGVGVIDVSMLTGEPIPQDVEISSDVYGGTTNIQGSFNMEALKVGEDTAIANIIKIVKEAQDSKAEIQKIVDKISTVFVPTILIIASITILIWLISAFTTSNFSYIPLGISSLVSVLVIACPCALGLATPTAIVVGIGKAAQNGILVKNAESLENLNKIDTIIFDKTGTLTKGIPKVEEMEYIKGDEKELNSIIYTLESLSQHPLAISIINHLKDDEVKETEVKNFKNIDGKGIEGEINNTPYYIGKPKYIEELGIKNTPKFKESTGTTVLLANKKEVLVRILISDPIKEESKKVIDQLHSLNIETVMITGDNESTAKDISKELGIDKYFAEVLPHQKAEYVKKFQKEGKSVAMIGDGINDAPALALADVSIAMATGTEIAISTSDITLLGGDLNKIVISFKVAKATLKTIKQNLFWAFIYNIICIPLAAGLLYPLWGILLNPIFAGLAMAFSSFSVVANSLRLKILKINYA